MKTSLSKNLIHSLSRMFAVTAFILSLGFVQPVQAGYSGEKSNNQTYNQVDKTPMYADPKYANSNMTDATQNYDQKALTDGGPPPPGDPIPNETPVPSSILPLLAMALGLVLLKLHFQLKKAKK